MRTSPILDFLALLLSLLLLIAPAVAQDTKAVGLVKAFHADRTFFGQFEVAKEIVALHDSSVLSQLESHLKDEDRLVRGNAAFIFAVLGDDRGFDVICDILKDRSQRRAGQGVA